MDYIRTIVKNSFSKNHAVGCNKCEASCQSACKTSCTVGNQSCAVEKDQKLQVKRNDNFDK